MRTGVICPLVYMLKKALLCTPTYHNFTQNLESFQLTALIKLHLFASRMLHSAFSLFQPPRNFIAKQQLSCTLKEKNCHAILHVFQRLKNQNQPIGGFHQQNQTSMPFGGTQRPRLSFFQGDYIIPYITFLCITNSKTNFLRLAKPLYKSKGCLLKEVGNEEIFNGMGWATQKA